MSKQVATVSLGFAFCILMFACESATEAPANRREIITIPDGVLTSAGGSLDVLQRGCIHKEQYGPFTILIVNYSTDEEVMVNSIEFEGKDGDVIFEGISFESYGRDLTLPIRLGKAGSRGAVLYVATSIRAIEGVPYTGRVLVNNQEALLLDVSPMNIEIEGHDYGEIAIGDTVAGHVKINNISGVPVVLTGTTTEARGGNSHWGIIPEGLPFPLTIEPNESRSIEYKVYAFAGGAVALRVEYEFQNADCRDFSALLTGTFR